LTDDESAHRTELEQAVDGSAQLRGRVRIEPPVPRDEIPAMLRGADALLSATQPHGGETLDKVVYEAAACGVPIVASNDALREFVDGVSPRLLFPARDADALAEVLLGLAEAGPEGLRRAGLELRRRVVAQHSVESWADTVAAIVTAEARK
jgi:glycosyltransferase involved in cell wall biosynthesis